MLGLGVGVRFQGVGLGVCGLGFIGLGLRVGVLCRSSVVFACLIEVFGVIWG